MRVWCNKARSKSMIIKTEEQEQLPPEVVQSIKETS